MKIFCFILAMFVIYLSTRPCCSDDDCVETETTAHHSQEEDKHSCGQCSPFMTCGSCTGFTFNDFEPLIIIDNPVQVQTTTHLYCYTSYFHSTYSADIWQPPQLA